jgi:hypothetical protein
MLQGIKSGTTSTYNEEVDSDEDIPATKAAKKASTSAKRTRLSNSGPSGMKRTTSGSQKSSKGIAAKANDKKASVTEATCSSPSGGASTISNTEITLPSTGPSVVANTKTTLPSGMAQNVESIESQMMSSSLSRLNIDKDAALNADATHQAQQTRVPENTVSSAIAILLYMIICLKLPSLLSMPMVWMHGWRCKSLTATLYQRTTLPWI